MGRLDELQNILNGNAPKPKQTGAVTMPSRIDGLQDHQTGEVAKDEPKVTTSHRDLGTKRDPSKMRKQVGRKSITTPIEDIIGNNPLT